jgi:hypothetical protein
MAADSQVLEELRERYERVYGRPLAEACLPGCSCRGEPNAENLDVRGRDEPATAER